MGGLKCNTDKTQAMMIRNRRDAPKELNLDNTIVPMVDHIKYLGVEITKSTSLTLHVNKILGKFHMVRNQLAPIIGYRSQTGANIKLKIINACMLPILDYGTAVLLPAHSKGNLFRLERAYKRVIKTAGGLPLTLPSADLWEILDQPPFLERQRQLRNNMLLTFRNGRDPFLRDTIDNENLRETAANNKGRYGHALFGVH